MEGTYSPLRDERDLIDLAAMLVDVHVVDTGQVDQEVELNLRAVKAPHKIPW